MAGYKWKTLLHQMKQKMWGELFEEKNFVVSRRSQKFLQQIKGLTERNNIFSQQMSDYCDTKAYKQPDTLHRKVAKNFGSNRHGLGKWQDCSNNDRNDTKQTRLQMVNLTDICRSLIYSLKADVHAHLSFRAKIVSSKSVIPIEPLK